MASRMNIRVKVCGLTNLADAMVAVEAGADALGFILAPSPRRVESETVRGIVRSLPPFVTTVGVFVDEPVDCVAWTLEYCGLHMAQLHGNESPGDTARLRTRAIKALRIGGDRRVDPDAYPGSVLLLDTYVKGEKGGTGQTFDWSLAAPLAKKRPVILAGGLNTENLARAVATVRPCAVDVSSGVEIEPGRKDHEKLREFVRIARAL